ncbi:MAG: hypothetical protein M1576_04180 [Deltaproteobacteria bacterium]|nr:hypothetical protein [Deltaproteobacteria bacterium]
MTDEFQELLNQFKDKPKICCANCKYIIGYNYCKKQNGKNIGSPYSNKCKKFEYK